MYAETKKWKREMEHDEGHETHQHNDSGEDDHDHDDDDSDFGDEDDEHESHGGNNREAPSFVTRGQPGAAPPNATPGSPSETQARNSATGDVQYSANGSRRGSGAGRGSRTSTPTRRGSGNGNLGAPNRGTGALTPSRTGARTPNRTGARTPSRSGAGTPKRRRTPPSSSDGMSE